MTARLQASGRVTFLSARYRPERYGGVEERLWHVTTTLAQRGCAVEVLTENRLGAPAEEIIAPGLRVFRFLPFNPGRLWRWFHLAYVRWWYRLLRQRRPSGLIWATDPMTATAAILTGHRHRLIFNPAACEAGMRYIGRKHSEVTSLHLPKALEWIDRIAYRWARTVLVSSQNVKQQFERFYGPRADVHVCPSGVELPQHPPSRSEVRHRLGLPDEGFVIGFVGRLDPVKALDYLFAAAGATGLGPDDRILIVGTGPDEARLRAAATQAGVAHHVVWAGRVNEPYMVLPAMDVLVLPSVYEAFGNVLLEGMAAGLPVIGRDANPERAFTASREIIEDGSTGFITDSTNPRSLADKLQWLRSHPAERVEMGRRGRARAEGRSWSAVIDDYTAVVPELQP